MCDVGWPAQPTQLPLLLLSAWELPNPSCKEARRQREGFVLEEIRVLNDLRAIKGL